jgi:large subunit ribosomal protein L19
MMELLRSVEAPHVKANLPPFRPGDTVKVHVKVLEGDKERIQAFEGVVMRRRASGTRATFTVRRVTYGVGVERTFHNESPMIDKVELVRRGVVRRARLYYLRDLRGKAARIRERRGPVPGA